MDKLIKYITVAGMVIILTACPTHKDDYYDVFIKIFNNSKEDIVWLSRLEFSGEWYEISSIDSWIEKYDNRYIILRGNTYIFENYSDAVKFNLRRGWIKYYLFNLDSIRTIPWNRICEERIILKEVTFNSWEDFERSNFEITYP